MYGTPGDELNLENCDLLEKLAETNAFKAQCQFHYKTLSEKAAVYKVNDVDDATGWSRFRLKLRDGK